MCVARRVDNTKNSYLAVCGSIKDDVPTDRKSADVRPDGHIEAPANRGKPRQQSKPTGDRFYVARCDFRIAAFVRDVEPDFVKIGPRLRRETYAH